MSAKVPVQFIKHHSRYNPREIAGFEAETAAKLVKAGVAVEVPRDAAAIQSDIDAAKEAAAKAEAEKKAADEEAAAKAKADEDAAAKTAAAKKADK